MNRYRWTGKQTKIDLKSLKNLQCFRCSSWDAAAAVLYLRYNISFLRKFKVLQGQFNIMEMIFLNILIFFLYTPTPSKSIPVVYLLLFATSYFQQKRWWWLLGSTKYYRVYQPFTPMHFIPFYHIYYCISTEIIKKGKAM